MNFTAREISVAVIAAWQGARIQKVLYRARMENDVPEKNLAELEKWGADIYAKLTARELELVSVRYPRRRDVRWF